MKRFTEIRTITYRSAISLIMSSLSKHYSEPFTHAITLFSNEFHILKQDVIINMDNTLGPKDTKMLNALLSKLNMDYPLSYILGNIEFYKENYLIDESVLIPRPETELLVELAIELINNLSNKSYIKILEVGTGSGCISISILKNISLTNVQIIATDVSSDALNIASKNVKRNLQKNKRKNIHLIQQDVLSEFPNESFDLILSNPPYIPFDEYNNLEKSLFYEPQIALTDFKDGLQFYKRLALLTQTHLNTEGSTLFELHSTHTNDIIRVFKDSMGNLAKYALQKDAFGRMRILKIIT